MAKNVLNCATLVACATLLALSSASPLRLQLHTRHSAGDTLLQLHKLHGGTEPQELRSSRNCAIPAVEDFVNTAVLLGSADELQQWSSLRGGGDGMESSLDIDEIAAELQDPEKMAEAMETLSDPEKMAEAREMMDDPDFRAMVMEALQRGGGKKVEALKAMLGDAGMAGSLQSIGPSLGASLDVLKEGCETADEFEAAAVSLHNLLTDLEEDPDAPVHRRIRLDDPEVVEGLLQYNGGKLCLRALGFTEEEEESTYDGGGASLCLPQDAGGAAMEYQRAHDLIADARRDVHLAANLSATHSLPYAAAQLGSRFSLRTSFCAHSL